MQLEEGPWARTVLELEESQAVLGLNEAGVGAEVQHSHDLRQ